MPDARTLWDFRETLIEAGALDALFDRLDRAITAAGYLPRGGQILDASLVAAPRQRNTDGEKAAIREGKSADEIWPDKPAKARQKDVSGRWSVKHSRAGLRADGSKPVDLAIPVYGYKSHVSIDRMHGVIRRQTVTDAARHDGGQLREGLILRRSLTWPWKRENKMRTLTSSLGKCDSADKPHSDLPSRADRQDRGRPPSCRRGFAVQSCGDRLAIAGWGPRTGRPA